MANRVITAAVSGESIKLSNKIAGASGSVNAVSLSFTFDSAWDGTTKKVYFFDANEENAVVTVLTTNLLVDGAYVVPIPAEPLAYAGEMTLTVRGVELGADGETAERIILSATTTMKVLNAVTPSSDVAPVEPTATQTEQLQAQIDEILGDVADIPDSVAACATSATAAAGSATNAATSETNASTSASGAASSASAASGSASAASASETNAGNSAASATSSASAAATSASNAATSESNALSYKNTAVSAANTAQTKASEAAQSATAASGSAGAADASKTAAVAAKVAAETAQTAAETAQTASETAQAAAIAAETGAEAAQGAAENAQAGAEAAQSAAETAEGTATIKATESGQSAAAALASKNTAAGSAATAVDSAATAVGAATDAQTAQEAAEDAQGAAETSAASAAGSAAASESWAVGGTGTRAGEDTNNAHYWSIVAQGAAAGGVSTFNGRSGAVVPQIGDYTPSMVGADASGAAAAALASSKSYADGLAANYDTAGAAATVQGNLDAHTDNTANPHGVTKAQVGLGNVPNVATNDQTPTYSQASAIANLTSGEKLSVAFGKIMKAIADFITHKNNTNNPHGVTAAQAGADPSGTASSAVSSHNSDSTAHSALFAGKADLYTGSLTMKIGRDANGIFIDY